MQLKKMQRLTIEADASKRDTVTKKLIETGALDYMVVTRGDPADIEPADISGTFDEAIAQRIRIDAVAHSEEVETIVREICDACSDDTSLDIIVSDVFGHPQYRWHKSSTVKILPRTERWGDFEITLHQ